MEQFSLTTTDIKALAKLWATAPKLFGYMSAGVLNHYAVRTRHESIRQITRTMTIRNAAFVKRSLIYRTAKGSVPVASQEAHAGSLERPRFSGWEEQQEGTRPAPGNVPALSTRTGKTKTGRVRPGLRLKPGRRLVKSGGSRRAELRMIRMVNKSKYKGFFHLTGRGVKAREGVYRLAKPSRRMSPLIFLHALDADKTKPKRNKWLSIATARALDGTNKRRLWMDNFTKQMHRNHEWRALSRRR